uniref:Movement protein TGBp3 n=1 Tax=Euonymus yellow mottle associated virus TaxID=2586645 RepID=A0A4Y5R5C9_9VIRU|nr:triple gene block protein 3 [Euonymus yellow mottle associated virus]
MLAPHFQVFITAAITLLILLISSRDPCVITITGESVRIVNCPLSEGLISQLSSLKPITHGLSFHKSENVDFGGFTSETCCSNQ